MADLKKEEMQEHREHTSIEKTNTKRKHNRREIGKNIKCYTKGLRKAKRPVAIRQ